MRLTTRGALFLALLGSANSGLAFAAPAKRVVIVSWDGAADWVVDRLLAEGKLPNLARLAQKGVRTDYAIPASPSKTACGHAAIWTGCYGDVNGITGNSVPLLPRNAHTLLETLSGFNANALLAEPLWVTAAKAGKKVVVLSATQSYPPDPTLKLLQEAGVPEGRYHSFSGFESEIEAGKVWAASALAPATGWAGGASTNAKEMSLKVGDATFYALAYDDPSDPTQGLDTVRIQQGGKEASQPFALLKPRQASDSLNHWSKAFRVSKGELVGNTYFRLFDLAPDGSHITLYQRGANALPGASTKAEQAEYLAAYGGFHDAPFDPYKAGTLGPTLWQGGNGEAEKRLLETIRLDCDFLKRGVRYALKKWNPDLLFHYTPMSDSAGHMWMGVLDPESPRYNPALAQKIQPFYDQVYQLQDDWLGAVVEAAGKEAAVCLVSDHGMHGIGKAFSPNTVLEKAGLFARTPKGTIDLKKTKICAPPSGDYYLRVNGTDWKEGIVSDAEREGVIQAAITALLATTDPETGKPVVTRIFRPEQDWGVGMGGVAGGDLYIDLAPGYYPSNRYTSTAVTTDESPIGGGVHGFTPFRRKMHAICFFGGAGLKQGIQIGGIRQIDIAPTLSRLLGIPAPAQAQGHVLGEALK